MIKLALLTFVLINLGIVSDSALAHHKDKKDTHPACQLIVVVCPGE